MITTKTPLCLLTALVVISSLAHGATVDWGTPQQITAASDVSTVGTLIGAYNVGAAGVPSTTVNGVTFQSFATASGNGSSGNFTTVGSGFLSQSNTAAGSSNPPFSALSAAYQTLLMSYSTPFGGTITLTISGLVLGAQYQFQWWANNSNGSFGGSTTATAGNTVSLSGNTAGADGGLGQWVIGGFTADSAMQTITFSGDGDYGFVNAFQLRRLQPIQGVPESGSTLALLGCALAGIALAQRKLRCAS